MNDNVTYGYLVPELMNICFWFCVYLFYCWHSFFLFFFAMKSYFDEFNIWSDSGNGSVNLRIYVCMYAGVGLWSEHKDTKKATEFKI
jgi:hypothetical protein